MKQKTLLRTFLYCLSVVIMTGCTGNVDNRDHPAKTNGLSVYEQRLNPSSYKELRGNGMNGINPDGSGTSDSKWNNYRPNDIRNQRFRGYSITGRTDNGANGGIIGKTSDMAEYLRPLGVNDVLVLGDIVVLNVENRDTKDGGAERVETNPTDFRQYFGMHSLVLKVRGQKAAEAMRRIKETLDSGNAAVNANTIVTDMKVILQHASP